MIADDIRIPTKPIWIHLSKPPPSVNKMFRNLNLPPTASGKRRPQGRVKTAEYKKWIDDMGSQVVQSRPGRLENGERCIVDISVGRTNEQADIDNRVKAILDLLVDTRIIKDDSKIEEIHVRWRREAGVTVCVMALPEGWERP